MSFFGCPKSFPALCLGLALVFSLQGCGDSGQEAPPLAPDPTHSSEVPPDHEPSPQVSVANSPAFLDPEDTLEAWLQAQESGDFGWAMSYLVSTHHQAWQELSESMVEDDLISSGLQMRESDYLLNFKDDKLAVFWSKSAHLYLVMVKEDGYWRVHPHKTDEMNLEASTP